MYCIQIYCGRSKYDFVKYIDTVIYLYVQILLHVTWFVDSKTSDSSLLNRLNFLVYLLDRWIVPFWTIWALEQSNG